MSISRVLEQVTVYREIFAPVLFSSLLPSLSVAIGELKTERNPISQTKFLYTTVSG